MLKRLRIKFVATVMSIFTLMLILIFALILHFTHENYIEDSLQKMRSVVMEPFVPDRPDGHRGFSPFPHFVLALDAAGRFSIECGDEFFDLSDRTFMRGLLDDALRSPQPDGIIAEHKLRFMRISQPDGSLRVVFMDARPEFLAMQRLIVMLISIGFASIGVFCVISFSIAGLIIKPVEKAWIQQRQFVADASHELKTPLAVIITNSELLNTDGFSGEERAVFTDNILKVSRQMRKLVENLLELARADNGSMQMNMCELDLSEMLTNAVLLFEPLCFESGLTLESSIESGITIKACEEYLRQVPEILLDNAIKYSFPGSTVNLKLERSGTSALLSVANSGPAISHGDLENIFKRFYRADKSRTDHSYGLGLSIAESIVSEHKGKIWAESEKGVNTFKVKLPV